VSAQGGPRHPSKRVIYVPGSGCDPSEVNSDSNSSRSCEFEALSSSMIVTEGFLRNTIR
jgi:hypothetical protein